MSRFLTALAIVGWCLAFAFGLLWRQASAPGPTVPRLQVDSVHVASQLHQLQATDSLVHRASDTVKIRVTHWVMSAGRVDTLHDTVTRAAVRDGNALAQSCTDQATTCALFRQQTAATLSSLHQQYQDLDRQYQRAAHPRRLGLGLFGGEAVTIQPRPELHPVVGVGVTYRVF